MFECSGKNIRTFFISDFRGLDYGLYRNGNNSFQSRQHRFHYLILFFFGSQNVKRSISFGYPDFLS